ncbi:ethanolamine ammonia-lyase subunit EutC [Desulfovibrio legallii]|uniref:Ethanolamine ammonia-lyase small subunit n=1 Tax=Desulfovibrio legallii TaxID=571438 RepID=A0A1G7HRQ4_9BACT|nr:ethanolamine ammonia-lyase subunit EutC [Desulfovibrio legallii]SDF03003.1 Ethanolamine ammonia-lyase light chain [Desulfovibrio legallii]
MTPQPAPKAPVVAADPWAELRGYTDARIALGRCGVSLPHDQWLRFRLAHAQARDAVLTPFDAAAVRAELEAVGLQCLELTSAARDKEEFLTRPDKGRRLSEAAREELRRLAATPGAAGADVSLVISDGLSARAVHENAAPFAVAFLERVRAAGLSAAPVALVRYGRVAVADEVASLLQARLTVILIGERPGLSSPNSLGVYLTYAPFPGCTDEARNCISNVRPGGLSLEEGVRKLCYLVQGAFTRGFTGVNLKDDMPSNYLPFAPQYGALAPGGPPQKA